MRSLLGSARGFLTSWQLFFLVIYYYFFFFVFLSGKGWGAGVTLFELAYLAPIILTTNTNSKFFYLKAAFALLITSFIWLRADPIIIVISFLTTVGLNTIIFHEARSGILVSPNYLFTLPFIWLEKLVFYTRHFFEFLFKLIPKLLRIKRPASSILFKRVFVGILFSLPFLITLVILFSGADQNFQKIFIDIFGRFKLLFDLKWLKDLNLIWKLILKMGLFWLYLCLVLPYKEIGYQQNNGEAKYFVEKFIVGILVASVFAVFIAIQFKSVSFILDGFTTGMLNPGAFVREGFYQLLIACLVGLSVFHILKRDLFKNFLTLFLLIEIFLVSLVAGERVWLYQYQFGLTQARVWGILFLAFLISAIVTMFLNLKGKVSDQIKWQTFLLSFSFFVFSAGLINIDRLIALYRPPMVEGKVDVRYISNRLSWDAADLWATELKNTESNNLDYKYSVALNLRVYIANLTNYDNLSGLDIDGLCKPKSVGWLYRNVSFAYNKNQICQNYVEWMNFIKEYELSHGISQSCTTLGTQLIISPGGKNRIGCDVEVNRGIDLSRSYCEGQKTHIKSQLIPDAYKRPNRYYATLTNFDPDEEVKVFVFTQAGTRLECLPSLNKTAPTN
ncbi:MAG: DUF4153 domain-containing protein [Patescibacteria group bacterium]